MRTKLFIFVVTIFLSSACRADEDESIVPIDDAFSQDESSLSPELDYSEDPLFENSQSFNLIDPSDDESQFYDPDFESDNYLKKNMIFQ